MHTAQVIPFRFEAREVRTILINDQPWFIAADVSAALEYRIAGDMTRNLDDDEKGTQIVRTPGGEQEMLVINESGLYSAILRSRKSEAKRFKKWVTAEVLPAIRKHGRYESPAKPKRQPKQLANGLSLDQQKVIKSLVKARISELPEDKRAKAAITCWSSLKSKFGCTYKAIDPQQFTEAVSLVARIALEGELLPQNNSVGTVVFDAYAAQHVYLLMSHVSVMRELQDILLCAGQALDSPPLISIYSQIRECVFSFNFLDRALGKEIYQSYRSLGVSDGGYAKGSIACA
jgi:prophage antirepressor-like protein